MIYFYRSQGLNFLMNFFNHSCLPRVLSGVLMLALGVSFMPPDALAARKKRANKVRISSVKIFRDTVNRAIKRECRITGELGVHIRSISAGETLFSHRAEEKRVPASNMKLMTTAAALGARLHFFDRCLYDRHY